MPPAADELVGPQAGQRPPWWGDPGGDLRVAQAAGPASGGEVDAGPGFGGGVGQPAQRPGEHVEPAGLQGGDRGGVVLVGQPLVDLGDRGPGEVGGQQQPGQQLGGGLGPDGVLLVLDLGDEVPGQAFGFLDGGDRVQRVPPPRLRGAGHALRVEHPRRHGGELRAQGGGVEDVELVAGGHDRTGGRADRRDGHAGGLAGSGGHHRQDDVLPSGVAHRPGAVAGVDVTEGQADVLGLDRRRLDGGQGGAAQPGGGGLLGGQGKVGDRAGTTERPVVGV